jgi:hypothetical protein
VPSEWLSEVPGQSKVLISNEYATDIATMVHLGAVTARSPAISPWHMIAVARYQLGTATDGQQQQRTKQAASLFYGSMNIENAWERHSSSDGQPAASTSSHPAVLPPITRDYGCRER